MSVSRSWSRARSDPSLSLSAAGSGFFPIATSTTMTSETHAPNCYTCSCAQMQFVLKDSHMDWSPQGKNASGRVGRLQTTHGNAHALDRLSCRSKGWNGKGTKPHHQPHLSCTVSVNNHTHQQCYFESFIEVHISKQVQSQTNLMRDS